MNRKMLTCFLLILLLAQCCVAYAIDTDEGEIILGTDDMPYITEIYSYKERKSCTKLKLIDTGNEFNVFYVKKLMCMPNIEELYIQKGVYLDDYSKLKAFRKLRVLSLPNQYLTDISFLADLPNLEEVYLNHNLIQNIDAIEALKHLKIIDLSDNNITDISALKNETGLIELYLDSNKELSDLEAISSLRNLEVLSISGTNVKDLSPISGLTDMDSLYFDGCKVEDITCLSELTKMFCLDMRYNSIKNIEPLSKMHELKYLYLAGNPITDYSVLDLLHKSLESAMYEPLDW